MKKDFGAQTWLYPMPVLIIGTYDEDGRANAMTAAWGGIHDTNRIAVCIDHRHRTARNLTAKRAFTVAMGDADHVAACDFLGLVSGDEDPEKVARAGFTPRRSAFVDAPVFEELPLVLECRLLVYTPESDCAVGEIVNVAAEERILDAAGKITLEKFAPLCFDPVAHTYRKPGEVVGSAFKDGLRLKA